MLALSRRMCTASETEPCVSGGQQRQPWIYGGHVRALLSRRCTSWEGSGRHAVVTRRPRRRRRLQRPLVQRPLSARGLGSMPCDHKSEHMGGSSYRRSTRGEAWGGSGGSAGSEGSPGVNMGTARGCCRVPPVASDRTRRTSQRMRQRTRASAGSPPTEEAVSVNDLSLLMRHPGREGKVPRGFAHLPLCSKIPHPTSTVASAW